MNPNKIPTEYLFTLTQQAGNTTDKNFAFHAWLPESFSYSQSANYEAPFLTATQNILGHAARMFGYNIVSPVMTAQMWMGSETPEFTIEVTLETETDPILDIKEPFLGLLKLVTPSVQDGMLHSPGPSLDVQDMISAYMQNRSRAQVANEKAENLKAQADQAGTSIADPSKVARNSSATRTGSMKGQNEVADYSPLSRKYWTDERSGVTKISNQISISIGRYLYFPSVVVTNVESELLHIINGASGFPMSANISISFKPLFTPTIEDLQDMFYHERKQ